MQRKRIMHMLEQAPELTLARGQISRRELQRPIQFTQLLLSGQQFLVSRRELLIAGLQFGLGQPLAACFSQKSDGE